MAMEPALDSAEVGVVGRLLMLEELLLLRICLMALMPEPHDLGVLFWLEFWLDDTDREDRGAIVDRVSRVMVLFAFNSGNFMECLNPGTSLRSNMSMARCRCSSSNLVGAEYSLAAIILLPTLEVDELRVMAIVIFA